MYFQKVFYYFGPLQCNGNVLKFLIQINVINASNLLLSNNTFDVSKQTWRRRFSNEKKRNQIISVNFLLDWANNYLKNTKNDLSQFFFYFLSNEYMKVFFLFKKNNPTRLRIVLHYTFDFCTLYLSTELFCFEDFVF